MKRILFSIIIVFAMANTQAQYNTIPLYDAPAPGNKDVHIKEKTSKSGSGSTMVTNVVKPELWHFATDEDGAQPAIIICPGGGYRYEAYEHEGIQVAQWLASLGYHAFVLKYRLPQENLFTNAEYIPLVDARQAILKVRNKADELGINPDKTGIMGFSAGGHLAASASTLFDHEIPFSISGAEVRPSFSILIYPVISMTDSLTHQGSKKALLGESPSQELIELFTLENQVTASTPITFMAHAADDGGVHPDNTRNYAKALKQHNVPVEMLILPKGGHGFGFRKESPAFKWTEHLAKWLKNNIDNQQIN